MTLTVVGQRQCHANMTKVSVTVALAVMVMTSMVEQHSAHANLTEVSQFTSVYVVSGIVHLNRLPCGT